jgi:hypothetical protein
MKKVLTFFIVLAFVACATGEKMSRLNEGMTKDEVVEVLGKPDGFRRTGDYEVLTYTNRLISGWSYDTADYHVVLKNGEVVEYGAGEVRVKEIRGSAVIFIVPLR